MLGSALQGVREAFITVWEDATAWAVPARLPAGGLHAAPGPHPGPARQGSHAGRPTCGKTDDNCHCRPPGCAHTLLSTVVTTAVFQDFPWQTANHKKNHCKSTANNKNQPCDPQACQQHFHRTASSLPGTSPVHKPVNKRQQAGKAGQGEQVRNSRWINSPYTHLPAHAIDAARATWDSQLVGCTAYETGGLYAVFHKISHLI